MPLLFARVDDAHGLAGTGQQGTQHLLGPLLVIGWLLATALYYLGYPVEYGVNWDKSFLGMSVDLLLEHASGSLAEKDRELLVAAHEEVVRMKSLVRPASASASAACTAWISRRRWPRNLSGEISAGTCRTTERN